MRAKTLRGGPLALVALGLAYTLATASWASQQAEETVMVGGQKLLLEYIFGSMLPSAGSRLATTKWRIFACSKIVAKY